MGFWGAVRAVIANYAGFGGRARRSEYWYFVLFTILLSLIVGVLDGVFMPPLWVADAGGEGGPVAMIYPLATIVQVFLFLPGLAVLVRRLHDTDRSGWRLLWPAGIAALAMLGGALAGVGGTLQGSKFQSGEAGGLLVTGGGLLILAGVAVIIYGILMIIWLCRRGTQGPNRFGPDPLAGI